MEKLVFVHVPQDPLPDVENKRDIPQRIFKFLFSPASGHLQIAIGWLCKGIPRHIKEDLDGNVDRPAPLENWNCGQKGICTRSSLS